MRMTVAAALLLIGAAAIAIAPMSAVADTTHYTVQAGDYLVLIGQKFGISWQSIAEANSISSPFIIYPGQSLVIPPRPDCEGPESEGTQYTVVSGDYLVLIGQHLGVPWQEIAEANCINAPYVIYPGQVLAIPQEKDEDQD